MKTNFRWSVWSYLSAFATISDIMCKLKNISSKHSFALPPLIDLQWCSRFKSWNKSFMHFLMKIINNMLKCKVHSIRRTAGNPSRINLYNKYQIGIWESRLVLSFQSKTGMFWKNFAEIYLISFIYSYFLA